MSERSQWSRRVDLLLLCLPALVLFFGLPIEMFLQNQHELNYDLTTLGLFVVLGGVWLVAGLAALRWLPETVSGPLVRFATLAGFFFLLSDLVAPVQLADLEGTVAFIPEPVMLTIFELALFAALLLAWRFVPAPLVRRFGTTFAIFLLIFLPIRFVTRAADGLNFNDPDATLPIYPAPELRSGGPNIYHLVFDAYSGNYFEASLDDDLRKRFDGFIFYPKNRTNYLNTRTSRPSFMTGTLFKDGSLKEWMDTHRTGGVPTALHDAGYRYSLYVQNRGWLHDRASHVVTNVGLNSEANGIGLALQLGDLWLVRAVPNSLQNEVYWEGRGLFTRAYMKLAARSDVTPKAYGENRRVISSAQLVRRIISDESLRSARGEYVHAHIYIPHGPYVLDEDCQYHPPQTSYDAMVRCGSKLMADFFDELRRLDRYEDSLIIIHADTGSWEHGPQELPPELATPDVAAAMVDNVRKMPPAYLDNESRAILLVKPPGRSNEPLETSQSLTQLLDVPITLLKLANQPVPEGVPAQSLLEGEIPEDRTINIYMGYKQRAPDGKGSVYLGHHVMEGPFDHWTVNSQTGWKVHPDFHAVW